MLECGHKSLHEDDSCCLQFPKNYSSKDFWLIMKTSHLVQMNFSSCHGHLSPTRGQTHALRLLQKFLCTHGLIFMVSISEETHKFIIYATRKRAIANNLTSCYRQKLFDVSFSCACPAIDNEFRLNIVKVVYGSTDTSTWNVLTAFMINKMIVRLKNWGKLVNLTS